MIISGIDPSINGTGAVKFYLDDNLDITNTDYLSFTTVKKNSNSKVKHFRKKDFTNKLEQNKFMIKHVSGFVSDSDYMSMEDYAYSATGKVFDIAEYVGSLKLSLYNMGNKIRLIEPTVVKKYATNRGNCDKIAMEDEYKKTDILGLKNTLPEYKSPKLDIIDAFFMTDFLRTELKLRLGIITIKQLSKEHIEIFNRVTKSNPVNILARDFLEKP